MSAIACCRWSDVFVLREIMMSQTLPKTGKTAGELYRDVLDDYGSLGERRFYRTLKFLVDRSLIVYTRTPRDELEQTVTLYFRARHMSELHPSKVNHICRICGMIGAKTSSHPLHLRARRELRGLAPSYADPHSLVVKRLPRRPGPRAMPGPLPVGRSGI